MKVSVICHDLSNNCLGRAHVLARLLAQSHEVEIVGRMKGETIWEPLRSDQSIPIKQLSGQSFRKAAEAIDGDLLYTVKPKGSSLGMGLLARRLRHRPLIADVDDWEMAFFLENRRWLLRNALELWNPDNLYATWAMERCVQFVDAVTVSTTFLQARFGGTIIRHAREATMFDAGRGDNSIRSELGLTDKKVVLFLGSTRPHKGIHDILAALDHLSDPNVIFLIVGSDTVIPSRPYVRVLGPQPFSRLPMFMAAADVVVLAQRANRIGAAQLPAKVFDAMAMARPVIATRVSDLPGILEGCGLIVEPGDITGLAAAIGRIVSDPEEAVRLGSNGRKRFVEEFSDDAVRPQLEGIVEQVLETSRR